MATNRPRRIYIFDQPRTCSMLFQRLLSEHPQLGHIFHPFSGTKGGDSPDIRQLLRPRDPDADAQEDKRAQDANVNSSTGATSEVSLLAKILEIEGQDKIVCLKDHLFSLMREEVMLYKDDLVSDGENPTRRFSDDFLLSITNPIFLIRHPALMIRSFWDAQQTVFKLQPDEDVFMALTTLRWTSILYDWYKAHGVDPIVIQAYDIVYKTASVMKAVCSIVGIDPAGVTYEWATQEPEGHMSKRFMWKLQGSTGIERDNEAMRQEDLDDLEKQSEKWKQVWGERISLQLRHRVEEDLPFYEQMKATAMNFQ